MAELTIQIPDELAERLKSLRNRLPELLSHLVNTGSSAATSLELPTANLPEMPQAYLEVLDFLVTRPTPQDIIAFKVSLEAQDRLSSLLDKNREGILTEAEVAELDVYEQLEHLMILMKGRAFASVDQ
ncbi:hypothetical protein C7293_27845 [filamentous cyanobacterium CCT1]|nr:hypothetical protein C7293_27845 [filamentous cyanobacterium CCT1]PSN77456.1 hypothetical protein C8B47_21975 [filamentous cyanobacterium CCP4]